MTAIVMLKVREEVHLAGNQIPETQFTSRKYRIELDEDRGVFGIQGLSGGAIDCIPMGNVVHYREDAGAAERATPAKDPPPPPPPRKGGKRK